MTEPLASPPESALPPVDIGAFSGPLDLLLHLIRINEVSITDIPIVEITRQYTDYLDLMRELDLDVAAEYVYLASVLIYIKSRFLLPRDPEKPEDDPRAELVARLLEYEKFKRAAESFHEIDTLRAGLWPRPESVPSPDPEVELANLEVSLPDLVGTFRLVLDRYRLAHPASIEIHHPRFSVRDKMVELLTRIESRGTVPLLELFQGFRYRSEAITTFLAALELTRLGVVTIFQTSPFSEIHASRTELEFDIASIRLSDDE